MKALSMALAATLLALTACGATEGEQARIDATEASEASPVDLEVTRDPLLDQTFIEFVRDNGDNFDTRTPENIITMADSVCDMWRAGVDFETGAKALQFGGVPPSDAAMFLGSATQAYCPEYVDTVFN